MSFKTIMAICGGIVAISAAGGVILPFLYSDAPPWVGQTRFNEVQATLIEGQIDTVARRIECADEGDDNRDRVMRLNELNRRHAAVSETEYVPSEGC